MNLAQVVQSHALSFFHLSSPDLLFGFDAEPAGRHLFGVLGANPQLARDGIGLRRFGQQVIESLGGKRIHPAWVVPGGVSGAPRRRDARPDPGRPARGPAPPPGGRCDWYKTQVRRFAEEAARFGDFPSAFMGLVGPDGSVEHYDGALRVVDADGAVLAERRRPPALLGVPGRGGRALVVPQVGLLEATSATPTASTGSARWPGSTSPTGWAPRRPTRSWSEFRAGSAAPRPSSFHYHHARLIEILYCLERIEALLGDPDILSTAGARPWPASTARRASAWPRRPGARCCTTTGSTATASSSGPTWSSPPATTTWP